MLPLWPETPEIYPVEPCPDGLICITIADQMTLWFHESDLNRIHAKLDRCEGVIFKESPTAPLDPIR